ncbi:hypothetical protein HXA35_13985 [Bacillus sp. A301a_S52]|nr:hypothetical protein [Bacillus sp. A301a_S52]
MSQTQYYFDVCNRYKGRYVHITDLCGRKYYGKIVHVDQHHVYLQPTSDFGGYGYGFYTVPIALAAIGGFALGAAFFWI